MNEKLPSESQGKIVVFGARQIRRAWHDDQWYFSVVDIVAALTDSPNPRDYWYRMKRREKESSGIELSTFCRQLKLTSSDGKSYSTEALNTEGAFRIIQSVPSPKAEPFKRWLAQVGHERVQEIENPELAQQRMKELYRQKGYPDDWIEKRVRSVAIRDELTDEWQRRGLREQKDFAILTAEISKATFGLTPSEYKDLKGLKRENLRDHRNRTQQGRPGLRPEQGRRAGRRHGRRRRPTAIGIQVRSEGRHAAELPHGETQTIFARTPGERVTASWSSLTSTRSRPFDRPETGKIAVKVINHYGDEVLKVFDV